MEACGYPGMNMSKHSLPKPLYCSLCSGGKINMHVDRPPFASSSRCSFSRISEGCIGLLEPLMHENSLNTLTYLHAVTSPFSRSWVFSWSFSTIEIFVNSNLSYMVAWQQFAILCFFFFVDIFHFFPPPEISVTMTYHWPLRTTLVCFWAWKNLTHCEYYLALLIWCLCIFLVFIASFSQAHTFQLEKMD